MGLVFLFLVAAVMAIFASIGYMWGFRRMLLMLLILLFGIFVIDALGKTLISSMKGGYMGFMLVLRGGLGDIASGDLEGAAAKLGAISTPFDEGSEWLALLIVLSFFILAGFVLVRPAIQIVVFFTGIGTSILAKKENYRSVSGGVLGLFYGYLVIGSIFYLVPWFPKSLLPVPFLPSQPQTAVTAAPATPPSVQSLLDGLFQALSDPGSIQFLSLVIAVGMALILVLSIRRSMKRG